MSASLLLAQPAVRPSERGFQMRPLHEVESDRNVRQMHTPFTPYGTIERDARTDEMFRESLSGTVRTLVEEYVLETAGPLLRAVTVYPASNPNDLRIEIETLTMRPGTFRPAASFAAPHYLTQRTTRSEVTAARFILGLYMESLFTQTALGIARLVYAMRQVAYAWLRTIQRGLAQTMMQALPIMAHVVTQLQRQADPVQRSKELRQQCLLFGALFMLTRKAVDGNVRLRELLKAEARRRQVAAPDTVYVPEGARMAMSVTEELLKASTYSSQVASMALAHQMPSGAYVEVPPVQIGEDIEHAFQARHPIGFVHPGADPLWIVNNVNPGEVPSQLYSTTVPDFVTRQMVTVHIAQALGATGLWGRNGAPTALGAAFFAQKLPDGGTLRDYLRACEVNVPDGSPLLAPDATGNSLLDTAASRVTLDQVLAHCGRGGICPVGYSILRHVHVRCASAVATSGKPVGAILGQVQTDQQKTMLLESSAVMTGIFGANIVDHDRVFRVPAQVPIAHDAGGEMHSGFLARGHEESEMRSFREGRSSVARSWTVVAMHPGEPSEVGRLGVVYPNFVDPMSRTFQVASAAVYEAAGARFAVRETTLGEVVSTGEGMVRPPFYLVGQTVAATVGAAGQPSYTLPRNTCAFFGANASAESLSAIFNEHV